MMNTIAQIEKRRRELRRINYFLIYLLAMAIFGMFFFVDEFTGFFGTLKYNIFLRFYFVGFVVAFLFYLAQKEKQQSKLTAELISEMHGTSARLAKELRHKEFLSEISVLLSNLRDSAVLEQLFSSALRFFQADGGAVILRDKISNGWKRPLVVYPEDTDGAVIDQITGLIGHTGRSFMQPNPDCPEHLPIKGVKNAFGVPLRLEGRLFGVIAFWSDNGVTHDRSDLGVLEVIGREATNSRFTIELLQEKSDQFNGLLAILAKAADDQRHLKDRTARVAGQAKKLARQMGLPKATVEAVGTAAMLRDVDKLVSVPGRSNGSSRSSQILKSFNFPERVTEILAGLVYENGNSRKRSAAKKTPLGSRIITVADAYVAQIKPARGRGQSPKSALARLEKDVGSVYDETVIGALKELVLATADIVSMED